MTALQCIHCGKEFTAAEFSAAAVQETCPNCGNPLEVRTKDSKANMPTRALSGSAPRPEIPATEETPARTKSDSRTFDTVPPILKGAVSSERFAFLDPPQGKEEMGWLAHYRVLKMLGRGGMGIVLMAEDIKLERRVALKVMLPEIVKEDKTGEARKRFLREARTAASIHSDHIVTIHQVDSYNDTPYLAMEFLEGETLDSWLERNHKATPAQLIELGTQIAKGLSAAHERGLIHRDIKPANIWIEAPDNRVKILDFGLARAAEDRERLTQTGVIMGTPEYMAPEQADGEPVDARCDLFSFGCVLYEMATGDVPFGGTSTIAILKAVALKDPKPLHEAESAIPRPLSDLVMQLLAKKPSDRPPTAKAVVEAFQQIALGMDDPTLALAAGAGFRPSLGPPRKTRRKVWDYAMAGFVLVAIVGLALIPLLRNRPKGELVFGMTSPFSGPSKELGRDMDLGITTYFNVVNEQGGVHGRTLRLLPLDDGYEPDAALANMRAFHDEHKVFGVIGNVGTPTAVKTLPYALENKMLFFGAFTGAKLLRQDPPDRYVFNYRASYVEETSKIMQYLVKTRKVSPEQVAVFDQNDSYGDAGHEGVVKSLRSLGGDPDKLVRVRYERNTTDVDAAVEKILKHPEIRAVIMVGVYKPVARFVHKLNDAKRNLIFANVSFVGSEALRDELGKKHWEGVIVTQVVPPVNSQSTAVQEFREQLKKYNPNEKPSFVALEGYINAKILVEGLRRMGDNVSTDALIDALESIQNYDQLGIGTTINFSRSEHQASHKVWGTVIDKSGQFQTLDLD